MKKNRLALAALVVILILGLGAVFADLIAPYSRAITINGDLRLRPPDREHPFGADEFGRDVFARILHGGRLSLSLGILPTLASLGIALALGSLAGYAGGRIDELITRLMDAALCVPGVLLSLAVAAALGPGLFNLMAALTVSYIPHFTRIIRSVVLTVVENEYIEAARAVGTGGLGIIRRHILRNIWGPVIVQATLSIPGMILLGAGLSFIGLGARPPEPEWGAMLSGARDYLRRAPHLAIFPGVSIFLAALSFNLLGDGLRDALDPRGRN